MANRRDKVANSKPLERRPSQYEMINEITTDDSQPPVVMINIFDIFPDPQQPRRVIPHAVRTGWNGRPAKIKDDVFTPWFKAYAYEARLEYDEAVESIRQTIWSEAPYEYPNRPDEAMVIPQDQIDSEGEPDDIETYKPGPIEENLFKVVNLAASIHHRGLINPISIFPDGEPDMYRIETGERRWLAYHLLNILQDKAWFTIPSRLVNAPNVWKQAYENNSRDDLNSIGKARQLAILLMDLLKQEQRSFEGKENFFDDQPFYAQVKDERVPRGKSQQLMNGMGVNSRGAISEYRSFLKLPQIVWHLGDEYNWSRERLYELSKLPNEKAIAHAHALSKADEEARRIVLLQNNSPIEEPRPKAAEAEFEIKSFKAGTMKIARALAQFSQLKSSKRREVLKEIENTRRWLDAAELLLRKDEF